MNTRIYTVFITDSTGTRVLVRVEMRPTGAWILNSYGRIYSYTHFKNLSVLNRREVLKGIMDILKKKGPNEQATL